jgi:hypothetical protein
MLSKPFDSVAKRIENNCRQLVKREIHKYKSSQREQGPTSFGSSLGKTGQKRIRTVSNNS